MKQRQLLVSLCWNNANGGGQSAKIVFDNHAIMVIINLNIFIVHRTEITIIYFYAKLTLLDKIR